MFYAEVLTKDELEYEQDSLKSMLAALDRHLRWLQLLNYTRPWVLSVEVSARRISKTSSPVRKMEETEPRQVYRQAKKKKKYFRRRKLSVFRRYEILQLYKFETKTQRLNVLFLVRTLRLLNDN